MEGMFRAAAGEKTHWELKEVLDTGGCLDLDSSLPAYCWQSPPRGLTCVWPVRVPCGIARITVFDLARATG